MSWFHKDEVPAVPDTSGFEAILENNAAMGAEQFAQGLEFQKQQWAEQSAMQREVLDIQIPIMENQKKWSEADRERYETIFLPLQDEMIADAKEWSSDERQEVEAGRAQADVTKAFENQRQNSLRKLEGMGIDMSQTRSQAMDRQVRAQSAAAQAAAGNNARRYVEERGNQMKAAVSGFGNALPGQALGASQASVNTGSQMLADRNAMINANVGIGVAASGASSASSSAAQAGGNLMNSGYQNQLAGWQAQADADDSTMSAIGSMAGIAAMMSEGGHVGNVVNAQGIPVQDTSGGEADNVPVALNSEEYVVPAEIVKYKGTEFFDKLINSSRDKMGIPPEEVQMQDGVPGVPPQEAVQ